MSGPGIDIPAVFRAAIVAGLHVERRSYSRDPWRIVASDGQELHVTVAHPSPGVPPYETPMAYAKRRDADAALAAIRTREEAMSTNEERDRRVADARADAEDAGQDPDEAERETRLDIDEEDMAAEATS